MESSKTPSKTPRCSSSQSVSGLGLQALNKSEVTPSRNANYKRGKVAAGDRYVCMRSDDQIELANHLLTSSTNKENIWGESSRQNHNTSSSCPNSPATQLEKDAKRKLMRVKSENVLGDRVCAFRRGLAPAAAFGHKQQANVLYSLKPSSSVKRSRRHIAKSPERIMDCPGIRDDFYSSLADWSKTNVVAVALGYDIWLWYADRGDVEVLIKFDDSGDVFPTMVRWSHEGKFLSVGLSDGSVKIFDVIRKACLRTISVQMHRMACGCWSKKGMISYGTRAGRIYHHDVRVQQSLISTFDAHTAEVCGLKWSDDERYLTSGGADALVNVWDQSAVATEGADPLWTFNEHVASVKAVEYVPLSGFGAHHVATGGGTNDHTVRIWNLSTGRQHSFTDTHSQVSGILFSRTHNEMVTGHGNPHSGVRIWRYDCIGGDFKHAADLKSHGGRVLGVYQSPCSQYVMSTGEDETIRLWDCWKVDASVAAGREEGHMGGESRKKLNLMTGGFGGLNIR